MTRAKNLSAATFSHPWLKILGRALGAGAEQEEATRPVFFKSRSVPEAASSVPETVTELPSPQWHFVKEKAGSCKSHFLIKLLLQELGQNKKRNWFGLRSWGRTSPNGNFLIKLQELGQNEKKQGGKVPRQTEAKKLGSSGASCEAENTRGLGLYNIQTFDVCILSNRAWRQQASRKAPLAWPRCFARRRPPNLRPQEGWRAGLGFRV